MFPLLRSLFWLALFAVCTFAFAVFFEHGPSDYLKNAQANANKLRSLAEHLLQKGGL